MRTYPMENRGKDPRYYYLYKEIRRDILSGEFPEGEKLPSKRALAEHLGVSVLTVENAYQLLKAEGSIESREKSGYYVCRVSLREKEKEKEAEKPVLHFLPEPAPAGGETAGSSLPGRPQRNQDDLPTALYFKTIRSVMTEYGDLLLQKSPAEGCAILRNALARYLQRYRGIYAQPAQIIIGSGSEHLYGCLVRLLGRDRIFGIEDPSYSQIERVYTGVGARCRKLRMGRDGIESGALAETDAEVLHVTPFHSYPSGVTATVPKRSEYLSWVGEKAGRIIVEDDFDSEFFMPGKPMETLFSQDGSGSVIYMNSFSKSFSPSLRMAYMILPAHLLDQYGRTNGDFSCTVPVLDQYALAEFINRGYFEQHLGRKRRRRLKEEQGEL